MKGRSIITSFLCTASIMGASVTSCKQSQAPGPSEAIPEVPHLGEMMGQLQYYNLKLGLAVHHRNQALAKFYVKEVNETIDDIRSKQIVEGTMNMTEMFDRLLKTSIDSMDGAIAEYDTAVFTNRYQAIIVSCNNCHRETDHEFIVIEEPREEYNGQSFALLHSLQPE